MVLWLAFAGLKQIDYEKVEQENKEFKMQIGLTTTA